MNRYSLILCFLGFLCQPEMSAKGSSAEILLGPPSLGTGGSNGPTASPVMLGLNYVTDGGTETSLSWVPGLFFGRRFLYGSYYLSLGGGFAVTTVLGVGPYAAFGYLSGNGPGLHFVAEYRHAAGLASVSQYSLPKVARIGISYGF